MKKLLISLVFLLPVVLFAQGGRYNGWQFATGPVVVAKFNFSSTANVVSGWVNVTGDPDDNVITASDSRSGSAIGFSSVNSTDFNYWNPTGGVNSAFVAAAGSGHVIESNSALYRGYFFQFSSSYVAGQENVEISGLDPSKTYKFEVLGSRQGASQPTRNSTVYCIDNVGTTNIVAVTGDYNGDYNFVFTGKVPTSGGIIKLHVVQASVNSFGYLNLIKITQE